MPHCLSCLQRTVNVDYKTMKWEWGAILIFLSQSFGYFSRFEPKTVPFEGQFILWDSGCRWHNCRSNVSWINFLPKSHHGLVDRAVTWSGSALALDNSFDRILSISLGKVPRGNGVMDSSLACCAGGPGSIPAIGKSNVCCNFQMVFSPSRFKVVGKKQNQTPDKWSSVSM